jgi:hypothetical protein
MTRVPYAGNEKTEHALDGGNVAALRADASQWRARRAAG